MFDKVMQCIFITLAFLCFIFGILAFAAVTYVGYDVFKRGTPISCMANTTSIICFSRYVD